MRLIVVLLVLVALIGGGYWAYTTQPEVKSFIDSELASLQGGDPRRLDVDALLARLPGDVKSSYQAVNFDEAKGTTIIQGLEIADVANPEQKVSIARLEALGVDVAAFESVFDAASYGETPDETFKTLAQLVTISGLTTKSGGDMPALSVGTLIVSGLEMKQFPFVPRSENFESQFVSEDLMPIQALGGIVDSLKVSRLEVSDVNVSEPSIGLTYAWKRFLQEGIDRGRFGPSKAEGMTFAMIDPTTGMPVNMTAGVSQGEGADYSKVLPYMIKAELPPITERDLLSMGAGSATNMVYEIPDVFSYKIDNYRIEPVGFTWLIPSDLRFSAVGTLTPNAELDPELKGFMESLNQESFPFEVALDWRYDADAATASLERYGMKFGGLYGFDVGFGLGSLGLEHFASAEDAMNLPGEVTITGAALKVIDNGGTEKVIALAAQDEGMTVEEAMAMARQQIEALRDPEDPATIMLADALAAFLENPGTLAITASPPEPLPAMMFMMLMEGDDPAAAIDAVGLKIEALPPEEAPAQP
ncbi:MAG: hypothetical protein GC199_05135 [Alphaproteobacteria bacterium]|nr:hypothetical protein [Alphaproteobacteria bacterium]